MTFDQCSFKGLNARGLHAAIFIATHHGIKHMHFLGTLKNEVARVDASGYARMRDYVGRI